MANFTTESVLEAFPQNGESIAGDGFGIVAPLQAEVDLVVKVRRRNSAKLKSPGRGRAGGFSAWRNRL